MGVCVASEELLQGDVRAGGEIFFILLETSVSRAALCRPYPFTLGRLSIAEYENFFAWVRAGRGGLFGGMSSAAVAVVVVKERLYNAAGVSRKNKIPPYFLLLLCDSLSWSQGRAVKFFLPPCFATFLCGQALCFRDCHSLRVSFEGS